MELTKEQQKVILLGSFEILIPNYEKNFKTIEEIIQKLAKIDLIIAIDMWEKIISLYPNLVMNQGVNSNEVISKSITSKILLNLDINSMIMQRRITDELKRRMEIREAIFLKSAYIDKTHCTIISDYLLQGDFIAADENLNLLFRNKNFKNHENSLTYCEILKILISNIRNKCEVNDNHKTFFEKWVQQLVNPIERNDVELWFLSLYE